MVLFVKTQHALLHHLHASDSALLSELKSWLRILEDSRVSLKAQGSPTKSNHVDSGDTSRKPGLSHVAAYPALKLTQHSRSALGSLKDQFLQGAFTCKKLWHF